MRFVNPGSAFKSEGRSAFSRLWRLSPHPLYSPQGAGGAISTRFGYLRRNVRLALVEEMGHKYQFVLIGTAASQPDDDELLLGHVIKYIKVE